MTTQTLPSLAQMLRTQDVIRHRETDARYRVDLATVEGWHFTNLATGKAIHLSDAYLNSGAFQIVSATPPSVADALRPNVHLAVLRDGRISIRATTAGEATKTAQALQALGMHVRQYGAVVILHPEGK